MPTASMIGPISLARKTEVAMDVLSLRRHDPDQVQRVPAVPDELAQAGLSAPFRSSPRNGPNVGRHDALSTRIARQSRRRDKRFVISLPPCGEGLGVGGVRRGP